MKTTTREPVRRTGMAMLSACALLILVGQEVSHAQVPAAPVIQVQEKVPPPPVVDVEVRDVPAVDLINDVEAVDVGFVAVQNVFTDQHFQQWVFQRHSTESGARSALLAQLKLKSEDVHRACNLTDEQRTKIHLAGRGDIKRFFDRYEAVKKQFNSKKRDPQNLNEIWPEIQPLQQSLSSGVFHTGSFLDKSLRHILTQGQLARYETVTGARLTHRHRAIVELTVNLLEQGAPLTAKQRQELIKLLLAETRPSQKTGHHECYVIMWQIAQLPERRIRNLLDDVQWEVLEHQLAQVRQMQPWLEQIEPLPREDVNGDAG